MSNHKRDGQRSKVYAWERAAALDTSPMTLDEIRLLARGVCVAYRIAVVRVTDGRMRRSGCYIANDHEIRMPRFARTKAYALHELAHAITYAPGCEWHGAGFMRVYFDLLARWSNTEMRDARKVATEMRVRVARSTAVKAPLPARSTARIAAIEAEVAEHREAIATLEKERWALQHKAPAQRLAAGRAR